MTASLADRSELVPLGPDSKSPTHLNPWPKKPFHASQVKLILICLGRAVGLLFVSGGESRFASVFEVGEIPQ